MNELRYVLALATLMFVPGSVLFWFSLHPFVRFWRRMGARPALAVHYLLIAAIGALVYWQRRRLLAVEFGTNWYLAAIGMALLFAGAILKRQFGVHLRFRILTGLPELDPERYPSRLLTEGIYSRIRHPRYVQYVIVVLGYALISNYLAVYMLTALLIPALALVIRWEERELRQRFGQQYEDYCARVPRFIPRLHWRKRPH